MKEVFDQKYTWAGNWTYQTELLVFSFVCLLAIILHLHISSYTNIMAHSRFWWNYGNLCIFQVHIVTSWATFQSQLWPYCEFISWAYYQYQCTFVRSKWELHCQWSKWKFLLLLLKRKSNHSNTCILKCQHTQWWFNSIIPPKILISVKNINTT